MDFLKEHLGEELYKEVAEKLKDKGLKLGDLSSGNYIAKEKHARILCEKDEALKKKEAEIEVLKKDMPEGEKLKEQMAELSKELDRSKEEINKYRNEKTALSVGIKAKYVNAAICEAERLADKETSFEKAVERVAKDYPEWKEEAKPKQNSSFPLGGTGGNGGGEEGIKEAANAVFRRVNK
jgi:DNA repair exonuclease SbcCD ATPase subunit